MASVNGIVHLKGGIKTSGTNPVPFTLPAGDRPAHNVYVPVDLCNGNNGRLDITPNGVVTVRAEVGKWASAQCLTSLDGVSFARSASSFTPLTLKNGWANYGSGTASPAARNISGIVHLQGAMRTNGTNQVAFTLPAGDRPALRVFVPVDLCGATNGDLFIQPDGSVTVEAEGGGWSNAQCFTSLDGVSFARSASSFSLPHPWLPQGLPGSSEPVRPPVLGAASRPALCSGLKLSWEFEQGESAEAAVGDRLRRVAGVESASLRGRIFRDTSAARERRGSVCPPGNHGPSRCTGPDRYSSGGGTPRCARRREQLQFSRRQRQADRHLPGARQAVGDARFLPSP